jgi:protoporphyrinogen oxidase
MWEAIADGVERAGIPVELGSRVTRLRHANGRVDSIVVDRPGGEREISVDGVVSSIPLSELVLSLDPLPDDTVVAAARSLRYRDLIVVGLVSSDPEPFPDNWIYLHDPGTRAGRVQNFGAWSAGMTRPGYTCLGVEYFCFAGDDLWDMPDNALVQLAARELGRIGLLDPESVVEGTAIRVRHAYPVYDASYREAVRRLRRTVDGLENLETVGRNGLHRYNNQDHSMWTAVLGTLNLLDGAGHDLWSVNVESEYLEEGALLDALDGLDVIERVA